MRQHLRVTVLFLLVGLAMLATAWMLNLLLTELETRSEPEPAAELQLPATLTFQADEAGWLHGDGVEAICGVDVS